MSPVYFPGQAGLGKSRLCPQSRTLPQLLKFFVIWTISIHAIVASTRNEVNQCSAVFSTTILRGLGCAYGSQCSAELSYVQDSSRENVSIDSPSPKEDVLLGIVNSCEKINRFEGQSLTYGYLWSNAGPFKRNITLYGKRERGFVIIGNLINMKVADHFNCRSCAAVFPSWHELEALPGFAKFGNLDIVSHGNRNTIDIKKIEIRALHGFQRFPVGVGRLNNSWRLFSYFTRSDQTHDGDSKGDDYSTCRDRGFMPTPPGIMFTILGLIIFTYSCLGDRFGLDFGWEWPYWLLRLMFWTGLLFFSYGVYVLTDNPQVICDSAHSAQFSLVHIVLGGRRIGGDFITCLSTFWKFLHPGGLFDSGLFPSSSFSRGFGIVISPSPGRKSGASRLRNQESFGNALRPSNAARCNGRIAHQGI